MVGSEKGEEETMKIHAKLKHITPIRLEVWRHYVQSFEEFETFEEAARFTAACTDDGTASCGPATDTRTGEEWTSDKLHDVGWAVFDGVEG